MIGQEETASSCVRGHLNWLIRKKFFTKRLIKRLNRLPRELVQSPSLQVFESLVDVMLRARLSGGLGSIKLMVEFDDLEGLFQSK